MATLNTDFEDDDLAPSAEQPLSWQWSTWPKNLRRAAIFSVSILIACVALLALWRWADDDFSRKLRTQKALLNQAKEKLIHSDQERQDIVTYLPLLRQLEAAGIFGEEKRLEWIELLRSIEKRWPGVRIQYAIAAQILQADPNAPPVPPVPAGTTLPNGQPVMALGVFNTEMKLTLRLLHEGDALSIIEEVKAAALGHFTVRGCTFKRTTPDTIGTMPNLSVNYGKPLDAECTLQWTSLRPYAPT